MHLLTITIPLTVTDNHRHFIRRGSQYLIDTTEYRAWKEEAIWTIRQQLPARFQPFNPTYEKQLRYHVAITLKDKRSDGANYDKGIRDVLTHAGVWTDDKWCIPTFLPIRVDPTRKTSIGEISFGDGVFVG